MNNTASIAQEFYTLREEWARVDKLQHWQLAVWVAPFTDIDIIDKFMEIERLPIGIFDDIFFRFDTEYTGDPESFERALWQEYSNWFQPPDPKKDMLLALKNDGLLQSSFEPLFAMETGFIGLLTEMLRLKNSIKGFEKNHICIYFPPCRPDAYLLGDWLHMRLNKGIPQQVRLAVIDFAANRKIRLAEGPLGERIVEIRPTLNMMAAINNEMDKGGGSSDTVSIDNRFRKQIRLVMESTTKKNTALTTREVKTMITLGKQMGNQSSVIAALLVAAQAHYNIKDNQQSEAYADEAITRAEKEMENGNTAGYHCWKSCILLKGALLAAKRKWEDAISLYEQLSKTATEQGDTFFIMEGYRISGHLYYLRGRLQPAFEKSLLALVAGSYLDKKMVRESTFLHAAYVALFVARQIKKPEEVKVLENQLQTWIGEDWQQLLDDGGLEKSIVKPKSRFPSPF
jgi:tetratricopeptide (TPR) repeat protein